MHSTEVAEAFTECPAPSEVALENQTLLVGKVQLFYVKTGNMCMSFLPDTGQGWETSCSLLGPYAGSLCQGFFLFFLLLLLFKGGQSAFNKCLLQGGGGQALSP